MRMLVPASSAPGLVSVPTAVVPYTGADGLARIVQVTLPGDLAVGDRVALRLDPRLPGRATPVVTVAGDDGRNSGLGALVSVALALVAIAELAVSR
jgi:hypothetical protein